MARNCKGSLGAESDPRLMASKKTGTSVLYPKKLNSVNNVTKLEENPGPQMRT